MNSILEFIVFSVVDSKDMYDVQFTLTPQVDVIIDNSKNVHNYVDLSGWVKFASYANAGDDVETAASNQERPEATCDIELSIDLDGKPLDLKITSIGA